MNPGFIAQLHPAGPWRFGPASGARDRVDRVYHSDSLFSAITSAMERLGRFDDWLAATALKGPEAEVRFSSGFPWQRSTLFVPPPRSVWPPPPSAKIRWEGVHFVPLQVVLSLLSEKPLNEDQWTVDGASECLTPPDRPSSGPFRVGLRAAAAVDRLTGVTEPHATACLEFSPDAGLWFGVAFANENARDRWADAVKAAIRVLADSGLGGERSRGWGRAEQVEFADGDFPALLSPVLAEADDAPGDKLWWLLSLFSPSDRDAVDWRRGSYSLITRGGRVESAAGWGAEKELSRMVAEGSVLFAQNPPSGAARDVRPPGFSHPVFRSGIALAVSLPVQSKAATS